MSYHLLRTCPTCNRRQSVFFGTDGNGNLVETPLGCGHHVAPNAPEPALQPTVDVPRRRCKQCGEMNALGRQNYCGDCKAIRLKASQKRWEERRRSA